MLNVISSSMNVTTSLLVGLTGLLGFFWWRSTRRPSGSPPGPGPALPFIGHLHLMKSDPRVNFDKWQKEYGNVFSLYLGGQFMVVLCGYPTMKEAFIKMADNFSSRPSDKKDLLYIVSEWKGVINSSGNLWKEQRKLALEILRELGMGKNLLSEKIQEEVSFLVEELRDKKGEPIDLTQLLTISISNNICGIVFGHRFDYKDPDFCTYVDMVEENFSLFSGAAAIAVLPWLINLPGDMFHVKKILSNIDHVNKFLKKEIQTEKESGDYKNSRSSFIQAYLQHIEKNEQSGKPTTVDEENLFRTVSDLFVAGTETTSTTIQWALLFFLHYPEVQEKCFQEVQRVIGLERPPSMRDRPEMVYMEATIMEVLRRTAFVPLSVTHAVHEDVKFEGYTIPKHTNVIPYLHSVLRDPEIWGDPESFRPERFIDDNGKLTKTEEFIPFSLGRRACLGESLARMELFLYLTTFVQNFKFLPPKDDGSLPPLTEKFGITVAPEHYKIRAISRK